MKIRLMKFKDFDQMYKLWKEAGLILVDKELEKYHTKYLIKLNPKSNFVACHQEKIVGSVFGAFNGRRSWIYHLAIHPDFQKNGLGFLLLKKTEQALKKAGSNRVFLGVAKTNLKVMPFYKKYGYSEIDDAVILGKNL